MKDHRCVGVRGSRNFLFWSKVNKSSSCWEWKGYISQAGYGQFYYAGKVSYAHRYSYMIHKGRMKKGLVIDHLCRNRKCVNPKHLELVDEWTNLMRGETRTRERAGWVKCSHGHPFDEKNTYYIKTGGRMCLTCASLRSHQYNIIKAMGGII